MADSALTALMCRKAGRASTPCPLKCPPYMRQPPQRGVWLNYASASLPTGYGSVNFDSGDENNCENI